MQRIFHAMLGLSVAMTISGLVCGAVARDRSETAGADRHRGRYQDTEVRVPVEATIAPPLPLAPRYGEAVPPQSTLAWQLADGTDGAEVELSTTPTFEAGKTRKLEVDGERLKLPAGLASGVWYWRLRGRRDDVMGERTAPTWMLDVVAPAAQMEVGEPGWG